MSFLCPDPPFRTVGFPDPYAAGLGDIMGSGGGSSLGTLAGRTILLTGAAGFLGRWVVRTTHQFNALDIGPPIKLICVDAVSSAGDELRDENTEFIHHNLSSEMRLDVGAKLDYVIHAAGIASPYWYQKHPLETIDVAVHGARQCLELARKNEARFLFTSSSEVYHTPSVVPTPESYVGAVPSRGPRSCYDVSKLMGETLTYVYSQLGVDAITVRIHNTFGVGMAQSDHRVLPQLATAIKRNEPFKVFVHPGNTQPRRTYCPVENTIVELLLALARGAPGEVYNIGLDDWECSTDDLVLAAEWVLGRTINREYILAAGAYLTEPMRRCPDISKIRALGFNPLVPVELGLARFLQWALETYQ